MPAAPRQTAAQRQGRAVDAGLRVLLGLTIRAPRAATGAPRRRPIRSPAGSSPTPIASEHRPLRPLRQAKFQDRPS